MRYIYVSKKGGKPLDIGMNRAKRVAHRSDAQDRARVVKLLGTGLPMQAIHHQQLVRSRHRYYREIEVAANGNVASHFPHASGCGPRETARRVRQMDYALLKQLGV